MGVWLGPRGKSKKKLPPKYSYTGTAPLLYQTARADGTVDWELVFTGNCTIAFQRIVDKVDLFLVGGGAPGGKAYQENYGARGGSGGRGGECKTVANVSVAAGVAYNIVVGSSGQASSALGSSASSGAGAVGATGSFARTASQGGTASYDGTAGSNGTTAFGGQATQYKNGWRYGPGGGGGDAFARNASGQQEISNANGGAPGNNGATDAGAMGGDLSNHTVGYPGDANTGEGGGGGAGFRDQLYGDDWNNGGAGGSGIVMMRNAR